MAKLNKFDRAIRKQVQDLEAEPSARVWVGIREGIDTGRSEGMVWLYRSATAILFLALVGASIWWYLGQEETLPNVPQMAEELPSQASSEATAAPEKVEFAPVLAEERKQDREIKDVKEEPVPSVVPQPLRMVVEEEPEEELQKVEATVEVVPGLQEEEEGIEEESLETEILLYEPFEETVKVPDMGATDMPDEPVTEEQPESAATHRKQINFNNLRKNFSRDQLKETSGTVLGSVANGAKKVIGLDTEFEKTTTEKYENKEFTARLGPIKFKKSRKVKK